MGGEARLVGVAVAAAVALAGCAGEPSGAAVLPARGTTTAAPAPSSTADIAAEAVAVVKAYYAEINRAIFTGDTRRLRAMQTDGCACRRLVAGIDQARSSGYSVAERQVFRPTRFEPHDIYPTVASVTVTYAAAAYTVRGRGGRAVSRAPAHPRVVEEVEILREGARWLVSDVRQLSS